MANKIMKTLTLGGNTYEIYDESARTDIATLQTETSQLQATVNDLKENGTGAVTSSGWTTGQINLLDKLFDYIPWTNSGAGSIADSLIARLKSTSSGGGSGDSGETENEDVITQSGTVLSITSLKTEPTQSGSVLSIV